MAELTFWMSAGAILYTYIGYPVLILFLSLIVRHPVRKRDFEPRVTFLITAYNEARNIAAKLKNTLDLDYPRDQLEIIVASDGSTDGTDDIVREFSEAGVILHRVEGRVGKTETQNQAVRIAKGEIIVFSDATTRYSRDALRKLVRSYNDPSVGAVSGRYEYVNPTGAPVGLGTILFWKYENLIKSMQTRIRTVTGCCGCIYSVRRDLYVSLPPDVISDLVEPLKILEKGYRIVFEPEAIAFETAEEKAADEYAMRVRVITRGMNGLAYARVLLNPSRYGFVSIQLLSHKLLRWMIPLFLVLLFISNWFLLGSTFYSLTLLLQATFYGLAPMAWLMERYGKRIKVLFLPLYFCIVNLASAQAAVNFFTRRKMVTWETVRK